MSADISQSSLNLTSEEKRAYGQLFQQADDERVGVVTGDVAVKFFERTKLDPGVLAQIWQIADSENRGFLTPAGFSVALRLIGHCQSGREPSAELAKKPGPLPRFDAAASAPPANASPVPSPISAQTSGPIRVPPLTAEKVNEFTGLFERAGARNGFLGGDASRQMFERAKLPNETLGRIWVLVDTEERGALNLTEFIVAMHLITSMRSGTLRTLPQSLPAGLFDAAARRGGPPGVARAVQPQFSGSQRAQSPLARQPTFGTPPISTQSTGSEWLVSPQDKAKFDQVFNSIDKRRLGHIDGEQAVQFFSTSGLPEDTLASIWDLADINSEGQLSKDEFAVAMYLIRQQRSKTDDRGNLPTSLPPQLIPPTMRQRAIPAPHPTAPAFDNAANAPQQSQPKSAADDLFGLDALSEGQSSPPQASFQPRSPPPAAQPRSFEAQPFSAQSTGFKQFTPTSSFGVGLANQNTGGSIQSNQQLSRGLPQQSANDDLLGDNEPEVSNKLNSDTSELANMSNQIGTLRSGMSEVQSKKAGMDAEISTTSNQKRELETRLAQFRTQYEQEIREVKALEERLTASRTETRSMQQQMGMIEGTHADLQTKHRDLATQLEADQRENASLKEKTSRMNTEITQLKTQLEKLQADTRQQRGLVAINKKQLATSEAERDRVHQAMREAEEEKGRLQQEEAETSRLHQEAETARGQHENERARLQQETEVARARHGEATKAMEAARVQQQEAAAARAQQEATAARAQQEAAAARAEQEAAAAKAEQEAAAVKAQQEAASAEASRSVSPTASPASASSASTNPFFRRAGTMSPSAFAVENASPQGQNAFDSFFGPSEPTQPPTDTSLRPGSSRDLDEVASPQTPQLIEPPPPPESRQINSSALPLRFSSMRSSSLTSSVQANASGSRSETPTAGTPTESVNGDRERSMHTSSPSTSTVPQAADETVESTPAQGIESTAEQTRHPEVTESVPGAFPDSSAATTPTTDESTHAHGELFSKPSEAATRGLAEPTSIGSATAQQTSAGGPSEFPPIRELDPDDDSDSSYDKGFDDDFDESAHGEASTAAATTATASGVAAEPLGPTDHLPVPKPSESEVGGSTDVSALPSPGAELSPPAYDQTVVEGGSRESNQFPREYSGLLPSREIAHSPPAEVPQSPPGAFTGTLMSPVASHQTPAAEQPRQTAPADDFDSAFDDLSEAKEDTTEDAFSSTHREDHEFNPSFDSPAPSQRTIGGVSPMAGPNHQTTNSFDSLFGPSATGSGLGSTAALYNPSSSTTQPNGAPATSGSHDWDDLFSGLDNSAAATNGAKDPFELDPPSSLGQVRDGPAPSLGRSLQSEQPLAAAFPAFASSDATQAPSFPEPSSPATRPSFPPRKESFSPPPGPPPSKAPQNLSLNARPAPTRAISAGTEHDDPILKSLTDMGYPREKALGALEKYDYNIDMAVDHLSSGRK